MSVCRWFAQRLQPQRQWEAYYDERTQACAHAGLRRFYEAGVVAADTPVAEVPFVALDIETTGLSPQRNNIVSIGLVPFTLQRAQPNLAQHWLVKPARGLTSASVRYHQITHADLAQAPPLREVLEEVLPVLQERVVVCHYLPIERQFLRYAAGHCWQEEWLFPIVDTMQLERWRLQQRGALVMARWRRQEVFSLRLNDCRKRYGLPAYMAHHAVTDALAAAELLQAQWQRDGCDSRVIGDWWR